MGMATVLKLMSALCWVCGVVTFAFNYYFILARESIQDIEESIQEEPLQAVWDWIVDPLVLVTLVLILVVNVRRSLHVHNMGMGMQNLHMDVFTMVIGFTSSLYLYNYLSKFGPSGASNVMWTFLVAAVFVILPVSAIMYWRQSKREEG